MKTVKYILPFFLQLFCFNVNAQRESDIKILKILTSEYPEISVILKLEGKNVEEKTLLYENEKSLAFEISPVLYKDIKKEIKILFIIEKDIENKTVDIFLKTLKKLKTKEEINIGIAENDKENRKNIFFISPEFSRNKTFFNNFLNFGLQKLRKEKLLNNCKEEEKIKNYILTKKNDFDNIGIFIISDKPDFSLDFCPDIFNNPEIPVYFLQTAEIKEDAEKKIIEICQKSGGMYSVVKKEKNAISELMRFKEDLSAFSNTPSSAFYKIRFTLKEKKPSSVIKIEYGNEKKEITIEKPKYKKISKKEIFLTIFSSVLFVITVLLLFKIQKINKKHNTQEVFLTNPVEIHIKGRGINKTYFFEKSIIKIGRDKDNDIVINDMTVSSNHAIINREGKDFFIQDLGSTNGTVINQKKIKKYKLKHKESIMLGGVLMSVKI